MKKQFAIPLAIWFLLCACALAYAQKSRKDVPRAPLPAQIVNAKTIFLVNAGGKDPAIENDNSAELVYDVVYGEFKDWGKYAIVDSPDKAELVITVSYGAENQRTTTRTVYNTYTGLPQTITDDRSDPTLRMAIVDPKTKAALWQTTELREKARRQKNREKNLIEAAKRMISSFRERVSASQ